MTSRGDLRHYVRCETCGQIVKPASFLDYLKQYTEVVGHKLDRDEIRRLRVMYNANVKPREAQRIIEEVLPR